MAIIKAARINGIQVSVCGIEEIGDFSDQEVTHLISISNGHFADNENLRQFVGGAFPKTAPHFAFFDDVFTPSGIHAPRMEAVRTVLEFSERLCDGDYCLIHCAMGISRSTAMAFAVLCQHAGLGYESKCLAALEKIRPCACPNPLIVHFADEILQRNGAMIQAVKDREPRHTGSLNSCPSLLA